MTDGDLGRIIGTAELAELLGALDDAAITDPEVDASLIALAKGNAELLASLVAAVANEGAGRYIAANAGDPGFMNGPGKLISVTINKKGASSNTLTLYDNTAASGTPIAIIDTTDRVGTLVYNRRCGTGLSMVLATGTAADVTVVYEAD